MCSDAGGSALCIDRNVTIEAEVAGSVVLDAKGARRVIYVAAAGRAELVGLNITGGAANFVRFLTSSIKPKRDIRIISFCASRQGAGIRIDGTATLTDTNVYKNQADQVCSPVEPSLSAHPAPHWIVTCAHGLADWRGTRHLSQGNGNADRHQRVQELGSGVHAC